MLGGALSSAIDHVVTPYLVTETFEGENNSAVPELEKMTAKAALVSFITLVVIFILLLLVGKYLWNSVLISLFPFVKPAKSMWQILGLSILVGLIAPGCTCMKY
jgi:magnesium-transporting ATPase (P-type)